MDRELDQEQERELEQELELEQERERLSPGGASEERMMDEQAITSPYPDGLAGHHVDAHDTEMAAAVHATKSLSEACEEILGVFRYRGQVGLTDEEGQDICGYSHPKRRCDLYHAGKVKDSGLRRDRKSTRLNSSHRSLSRMPASA